jgi:hypothetical protein
MGLHKQIARPLEASAFGVFLLIGLCSFQAWGSKENAENTITKGGPA